MTQTVKQKYFSISESLLAELAADNDYWAKAEKFYLKNKDRFWQTLTRDQIIWLEKIDRDCIEELKR